MSVKIREIKKRLYLDYTYNGHRHTESLHIKLSDDERLNKDLRRVAETIRVQKTLQIASNEHGLIDQVEGKRTLLSYAEDLASKQGQKNALPKSLKYLRKFAGTLKLDAVTGRWVESYKEFLLGQSALGNATAGKYLEAIKSVLRTATIDLILPKNPAEAVKSIHVPETLKPYLSEEEMMLLLNTPLGGKLGAEVKRAFLFAYATGLRKSDVTLLNWGNIVAGTRWQIRMIQKKTRGAVIIPMNEDAMSFIDVSTKNTHQATDLVFPLLSSSKTNTNQYLVNWGKKAGVETRIGWHISRHTFGTLALEHGANIVAVQNLLGHKKIATTLIYAKSTDTSKRTAVDNLPSLTTKKEE